MINFGTANAGTSGKAISLNLDKSSPITLNLEKLNGKPLKKVHLSLIWDGVQYGDELDLDISCAILRDGKLRSGNDVCFYNNLHLPYIDHSADARTGNESQGDDDDEYIKIDLQKAESNVTDIPIFVTIYDAEKRRQTFGTSRSKIIIWDDEIHEKLVELNLNEQFFADTAVDAAHLVKTANGWVLKTIAEGTTGDLMTLINKFV